MQSANPLKQKETNTFLSMACVFILAVACYLLSFSGVPISDDEELYASAARNLAVTEKISAEQLYGNARLKGNYHGVEPAFPSVMSLWYRLFLNTDFGHLQSLYLLPIFFTGLSAVFIVLIASQLGFSGATGVVAGIIYAFSTMAWPYAKTLFREPFIAFLLLGSWAIFLYLSNKEHRSGSTTWLTILLFTVLVLLTLTKVTMVSAAFAFFITLLFTHQNIKGHKHQAITIAGACLTLVVGLFLYSTSLHASDSDIFYRYTSAFLHDVWGRLVSIPHSHLVEALLAPLISPWKGLFFYSPVCLLSLASLVKNGRRIPTLFILPFTILIVLLLNQALAYDGEWWTPTWGSRFLVPVIPLMVIASLPVIEQLMDHKNGRVILGIFFALGAAIQLPAVLFNSAAYTVGTYNDSIRIFPASYIWNFTKTPIINQWESAASQQPDLILWRTGYIHPVLALVIVGIATGLTIAAGFHLYRSWVDNFINTKFIQLFYASSMVGILLIVILVLRIGMFDPTYSSSEFQPMCAFVRDKVKPSDILIIQPYPGPLWQYFINAECGQKVWYSLPYNKETASNFEAEQLANELVEQKMPSGSGFWLIEQFWSESYSPEISRITSNDYQLSDEKYFYTPFYIFAGYYTPTQ